MGVFKMPFSFDLDENGVPKFDEDGKVYPHPVTITFEMLNEHSVVDINDPITVIRL